MRGLIGWIAILSLGCQTSAVPEWCSVQDRQTIMPIHREPPTYPEAAEREAIGGRVLIDARIGRDGRVLEAYIQSSDPPGLFDAAALKAFRQWRYCPLADGDPDYPFPVEVAIVFGFPK